MNKLTIIGNLTADPELRTIPSGVSVCTFTVAVNRRSGKEDRQTDFFRVTAWRQLGENCSRYLTKGKKVAVVGEVTARAFEGKDGTLRASLEVTADDVEFLSPRSEGQGYNQGGYSNQGTPAGYGEGRRSGSGWNQEPSAPSDNMNGSAFGDPAGGFTEITKPCRNP